MDAKRLKALVHYICASCRSDPTRLGTVKLHKILWYADGQSYMRLGRAILGEDYTRAPHGPMSVHLDSAIRQLEATQLLLVRTVAFKGKQKREYVASGTPDVSFLSDKEKRILDEVIRNICQDHSATSISEKSHDRLWEAAKLGELVPYQQQLLNRFPALTEEDQEWVDAQLKELRKAQ